ncbi:PREDICTED: proline transporter 2-like [Fragaria vesca subsp. vesca]|uniref:proline transporter 2-like n=1 Tax=Fragaria vesca subsp. vesca TaxID=101020 RepID=UPI0002C30A1E|nr:PREDICTED: proline transporter 2-like [Fragaria vesca subsp. vesca]XP_011464177.1 PREDICTED: proline transporter 2-like [Fragaria vesca subsp. vesca]
MSEPEDNQGTPSKQKAVSSEYTHQSAHIVGNDSWQQVGLMLVTSFNCGYILSFSFLQLACLGWKRGITCLLFFGVYTFYAHWLMAGFHIINGQRFIRFRDLMGYTCGRKMYYITFYLQYLVILLTNMGFILLGGNALKAINMEFSENPWRVQYYIVLTGAAFFIFAFCVPTMSHMGIWLIPSTVITFLYIITLLVVVINDGKNNTNRDYRVPGTKEERVFGAFNAISAIVVSSSSGLLPEIQSTVKKPEVANMRKALYMQYTVGILFYYGVSIAGYWAYGNDVSSYLPDMLSGPKWVKVLINAAVFLQAIVSQHTFVMPIHEALDTGSLLLDKSINSPENLKRRFYLRFLLFAGNTFMTAAIPFMADFVALFGALALIPLTLVFPSLVFIRVKGKTARLGENLWHWFNIIAFSSLALVATIAAVYEIVNSVELYSFFADS